MTGVTVVGVRGHLVAIEAHVGSCLAYELDAEPDPADTEVLQSLMAVGSQSALEFLG